MGIYEDMVRERSSAPAQLQLVPESPVESLQRRLVEVAASFHAQIAEIERTHMSALKSLSDQVIALAEVATGTVHPALRDLAARPVGVPEEDVQAQADVVAKIVAGLKASTTAALTTAGMEPDRSPAPVAEEAAAETAAEPAASPSVTAAASASSATSAPAEDVPAPHVQASPLPTFDRG